MLFGGLRPIMVRLIKDRLYLRQTCSKAVLHLLKIAENQITISIFYEYLDHVTNHFEV